MNLSFTKMHGNGNDFILVDNFENQYNSWSAENVRFLCTRRTGIGADGLLVLERTADSDFLMRFFNSDGYESEMCINGSRCISRFAYDKGYIENQFRFRAGDGIHRGEILRDQMIRVEVLLADMKENRTIPVDFKLPQDIYFRSFLNTGVPHIVLQCKHTESAPVADIGRALRFHEYYQPEGANVNFVELCDIHKKTSLKLRTFERGVDEETLSCGTGAAASVLAFLQADLIDLPVSVMTRGGPLIVHHSDTGTNLYVEGPVQYVYQGTCSMEDRS